MKEWWSEPGLVSSRIQRPAVGAHAQGGFTSQVLGSLFLSQSYPWWKIAAPFPATGLVSAAGEEARSAGSSMEHGKMFYLRI